MSNYIFPLTPGGSGGGGGGTSDTMWRPNVSDTGDLTWSRSTSTTPPSAQNIRGEKGDTGEKGNDGEDGKSAYQIWLDAGNTGTEQDFLSSLKGEKGADGTMTFDDLTTEQKESLKGDEGFSPVITENANNTGDVYKLDVKTATDEFTTPNLKGGGGTGSITLDEVPTKDSGNAVKSNGIFEALAGKQDAFVILTGVKTSTEDGFGNYLIDMNPEVSYSELKSIVDSSKRIILRVYSGAIGSTEWVDFYYTGSYHDSTFHFYSLDGQSVHEAFCASTTGWKIGVIESGNTPFIIQSAYTIDGYGNFKFVSGSCDCQWQDWYNDFKDNGRNVVWELHKGNVGSGEEVIRMIPNHYGIYLNSSSTRIRKVQFSSIGVDTTFNTFNNKYLYVGWWDISNNISAKRLSFAEIPNGGQNGYVLTKASDASGDVYWKKIDSTFVVTCDLATNTEDMEITNVSETFETIYQACVDDKNVELRAYIDRESNAYYSLRPSTIISEQIVFSTHMSTGETSITGVTIYISSENYCGVTFSEIDTEDLKGESNEILHTDLSGNLDDITTVLDLVNALLEEHRTTQKIVRYENGSISKDTLTDLPKDYGYLTIKAGGTNILEVTFAYSNLGFKKMYYGFLDRASDETLYSSLNWEEVNTGAKADIPIIENGKDVVYHKVTKNRSITELETYTDPNGGIGYKIDDLFLTYDCEKLAKGIDDWLANKGITPVKGTTYEDIAQIRAYSESAGGYVYFSTHIKFDSSTYLAYNIKYNDTDYTIISVQYDHDNGKTSTTFTGLNVFNIAKIIPELAGCYIQSDILDVLHNWFELYKPIGLEDSVGLYSKQEALLNQDLTVNASFESKTVGPFDLGNIVSLMTSPLQKLLFSVDSEGKNLKAYANDEKKRTTSLTNGLFGNNLLAPKNTFATLNDMTTLPTPPDGALGIWTVVPDAAGQPESTNKGGTLIIAHITSMLYSQTISYVGTRIAIYVVQGAIYYALGYGGKYYPTASWTPPSGGTFRWYKISSTLI